MVESCAGSAAAEKNVFLPREAEILQATRMTETEMHFVLGMKNGQPLGHEPGQILEVSVPGYGEIPIGLASSSKIWVNESGMKNSSMARVVSGFSRAGDGFSSFRNVLRTATCA